MANKNEELIFAKCMAELLHAEWVIIPLDQSQEPPDFEIRCAGETFGLEVTQVFVDKKKTSGSPAKKDERERAMKLSKLRKRYHELGGPPIAASFLGMPPSADNFLEGMKEKAPRVPGEVTSFKDDKGVKVTMYFAAPGCEHWQLLPDLIGWVGKVTPEHLQPRIDEKGERLPEYRKKYPVVELLIVACRLSNAGRLAEPDHLVVNNPGFRAIWFLSYPESIVRIA